MRSRSRKIAVIATCVCLLHLQRLREYVSDRPEQTPRVVLAVASHDSLTVKFLI